MPKFTKGSQEAKDYMKSIREKKTTTSNIDYETIKGKKTKKNITMDLDKSIETLPSGEKIIKSTTSKKVNGTPIEQNINEMLVPVQQQAKKSGRPKKYATPEEAKEAKKQQTLVSNKRKYAEKKAIAGTGGKPSKSVTPVPVKSKKIEVAPPPVVTPVPQPLPPPVENDYSRLPELDENGEIPPLTPKQMKKYDTEISQLIDLLKSKDLTLDELKEGLESEKKRFKSRERGWWDADIARYVATLKIIYYLEHQPKGGSLKIGKAFKKLGKTIEKTVKPFEITANRTADYAKAVLFGRDDYPPKVRNILKRIGDQYVKSITIKRTPVSGLLTGALSVFSLGKFGKRFEKEFDELFHLFIVMDLENGEKVLLEKNEVINMDMSPPIKEQTQSEPVTTQIPRITVNEMMDNTEKAMGKKNFFGYSASSNNCQDFIMSFFRANNIGDASDIQFIKQNTKQLFKDLPMLRKLANKVTNLGATVDVLTQGAGIPELKNYGMMLNHLTSHIADPTEPVDPKDYKQSKIIIDAIKKEKAGKGLKDKDYVIQSVIFDSDKFNITQAKKWLRENGYKAPKVDREQNTIRFRQITPARVDKAGFDEYRTKELGNSGIKLILAYKNKISSKDIEMSGGRIEVHHYHHMVHSKCSDSDSDKEDEDEEEEMKGGKINIGKAIKKGVKDVSRAVKATEKAGNMTADYVTKTKGGLASDLITYGIPATTGAVFGALGSATGNPLLGVAGTAMGSKLGSEVIAPQVHKSTGAGVKKGGFVKGSKEAREHMAKIRSMKKN